MLIKNNVFIQITQFLQNVNNQLMLKGIPLLKVEKEFDYPLDSSELNIFILKVDESAEKEIYRVGDIENWYICSTIITYVKQCFIS